MSDFIFQSEPDQYDLSTHPEPPRYAQRWKATRYRQVMQVDDGVFFYLSGSKAGIYGCGRISNPPDEETRTVLVQWTDLYPSPIPRDDLKDILSQNPLFTVRQGTNFLLSPEESANLRELVRSKGLPVPRPSGDRAIYIERGVEEVWRLLNDPEWFIQVFEGRPDVTRTSKGQIDVRQQVGEKWFESSILIENRDLESKNIVYRIGSARVRIQVQSVDDVTTNLQLDLDYDPKPPEPVLRTLRRSLLKRLEDEIEA